MQNEYSYLYEMKRKEPKAITKLQFAIELVSFSLSCEFFFFVIAYINDITT